MSVFNDLINIWKSDDLLSQAWDDSIKMLELSEELFLESISCLKTGEKNKVISLLKEKDQVINQYQRDVRKKVVTHFSINQNNVELNSALVLINLVVDVERIGDYCKNILDLSKAYPGEFNVSKFNEELNSVESEVTNRFKETISIISKNDESAAQGHLSSYRKEIGKVCDKIVSDCVQGKIKINPEGNTAALALYSRYLKRIAAHLNNVSSVIINPIEMVGYNIID